ncbi:hypothetical protein CANCADRAFT_2777 [Tortispora caseinolytica NRRL Y-17796]|uniref:Uncharacterized protein n=1 Tax=Tortispora caseinolytica NRRL Y-17796 TaxID=767744 RepID=A0A1E4TH22_9ASCO|nr:hypothetical protein CANCADRAFT_2777 [Tortispora caseinolytica NRRL Y-17796]
MIKRSIRSYHKLNKNDLISGVYGPLFAHWIKYDLSSSKQSLASSHIAKHSRYKMSSLEVPPAARTLASDAFPSTFIKYNDSPKEKDQFHKQEFSPDYFAPQILQILRKLPVTTTPSILPKLRPFDPHRVWDYNSVPKLAAIDTQSLYDYVYMITSKRYMKSDISNIPNGQIYLFMCDLFISDNPLYTPYMSTGLYLLGLDYFSRAYDIFSCFIIVEKLTNSTQIPLTTDCLNLAFNSLHHRASISQPLTSRYQHALKWISLFDRYKVLADHMTWEIAIKVLENPDLQAACIFEGLNRNLPFSMLFTRHIYKVLSEHPNEPLLSEAYVSLVAKIGDQRTYKKLLLQTQVAIALSRKQISDAWAMVRSTGLHSRYVNLFLKALSKTGRIDHMAGILGCVNTQHGRSTYEIVLKTAAYLSYYDSWTDILQIIWSKCLDVTGGKITKPMREVASIVNARQTFRGAAPLNLLDIRNSDPHLVTEWNNLTNVFKWSIEEANIPNRWPLNSIQDELMTKYLGKLPNVLDENSIEYKYIQDSLKSTKESKDYKRRLDIISHGARENYTKMLFTDSLAK